MNFPEMYIAAYYERVKHYATTSNLRFHGPAGRNWTDLDLLALPLPPLGVDGKFRPADVVQCKWRAKFTLQPGDEEWLDTSVVNAAEIHQEARRLLGAWPYRMVLITTRVWLSTISAYDALARRLDQTARQRGACDGAVLWTFEELAEDWRHSLGEAVRGWAEDPFSFHLQVLQLGQVAPPGPCRLPSAPALASSELAAIVAYNHQDQDARDFAQRWLDILVDALGRQVRQRGLYDQNEWRGVSRLLRGGIWVFLGSVPGSPMPVLSVWTYEDEQFTMQIGSTATLTRAAQRFYAWWRWNEQVSD